jgi:hypothetical protein
MVKIVNTLAAPFTPKAARAENWPLRK